MRPRWMTTIGILGIVFGCFGLMSAAQTIFMPTFMEFQRKAFTAMQADAARHPGGMESFPQIFESMMATPPAWFVPWTVTLGVLTFAIAGVYVFGAIWLLLMKPSAPRILAGALIASMAAAVARMVVMALAMGPMGIAIGFGSAFGVVIDLILLVVILLHRREWPQAAPASMPTM